jgi:hypothetical protein
LRHRAAEDVQRVLTGREVEEEGAGDEDAIVVDA